MGAVTGRCQVENCKRFARGGERFCPNHVEFASATISMLTERLKRREEEIARVRDAGQIEGWRFVDLNGSVASDIVGSVKTHGVQLVKNIGRHVGLKGCIVRCYVKALVQNGVLVLVAAGGNEEAVKLKS